MAGTCEVRSYESLNAIAGFADRLDARNRASRRPSPFATVPVLRSFLALRVALHPAVEPHLSGLTTAAPTAQRPAPRTVPHVGGV
jgi:hypothetical protein